MDASKKRGGSGRTQAQAQTPHLLFYRQPVALNRQAHARLRYVNSPKRFAFAREVNSVPLAAVEFPQVAREYPIVFAGSHPDTLVASALLGLQGGQNLFINAAGEWTGEYIPAFIRRYPFVLAQGSDHRDFSVCVDQSCQNLNNHDGEALFDDGGKETPLLKGTVDFLSEYQGHLQRTQAMIHRLARLELFVPQQITVSSASGPASVLQGLYVVDEKKLMSLPPDVAGELLQCGDMGSVYLHLHSLGNIARLDRLLRAPAAA